MLFNDWKEQIWDIVITIAVLFIACFVVRVVNKNVTNDWSIITIVFYTVVLIGEFAWHSVKKRFGN